MAATSFVLVLLELVLTRLFAVILFASFAHLALGLALLGISLGALAQHLWPNLVPTERVGDRLAAWLVALGASTVGSVVLALLLPVTVQSAEPPRDYGERSAIAWDLVDPVWFVVLLPVLVVPFAIGGLLFAGVFQRFRDQIGRLYAADLAGGAMGAVAFIPFLAWLPAPDLVWPAAGLAFFAASWVAKGPREQLVSVFAAVAMIAATVVAFNQEDGLLRVRYSAGYSEDNVSWSVWTPLTRIAVHEDARGTYLLLDNSSASEVVLDEAARDRKATELNRSLVYQLHDPPAQVAILAASAGPEVAVAQKFGFTGIQAIDIAPQIGDIVADRFRSSAINPFRYGDTVRVMSDGRAAIHGSPLQYDIIQMVHANLHSSAGLLANAWSSNLLETKEAFGDYLDHLKPDGTLSFARGPRTTSVARSVAAALAERGVADPGPHVIYVSGPATVMLVKARPWRAEEVARVRAIVAMQPKQFIAFDPLVPDRKFAHQMFVTPPLMTDDRPYMEGPGDVWRGLAYALSPRSGLVGGEVPPLTIVYHTIALQGLCVLAVGLLLFILGARGRDANALRQLRALPAGLLYAAGIGYGYLAIETILIHELVLFVGHPTYAVTAVVGAMLFGSGLGSVAAGWVPEDRVDAVRNGVLVAIIAVAALHGFGGSALLERTLLQGALVSRIGGVVLLLLPLGFLMGFPWPLFVRSLGPAAGGLVPWAWAVNGWTSVLASIATVVISRAWGYHSAYAVALVGYVLAGAAGLALRRMDRVG